LFPVVSLHDAGEIYNVLVGRPAIQRLQELGRPLGDDDDLGPVERRFH
jgi:hypothetical protein